MNDILSPHKKALSSVSVLFQLISFLILFSGTANAQLLPTSCANSNFSMGDFTDWQGCYGHYANPCQTPGFYQIPPNQRHLIIAGPGTADPHTCGNIMTVFPGEAYSARLGNDNVTGNSPGYGEQMSYDVNVTSDKYLFIYRYAVVLEDNGHPATQQPNFTIDVLDSLGNLIDPICGHYYVYAQPSLPGWHTCTQAGYSPIRYRDWQTVGMDLTPYLGQRVTIRFITRDCQPGGHFGYAYVSAYCSYLQVHTAMCESDTAAILTAPPGFRYLWSTGDTTPSIIVPHPVTGETINCTLTAVNGCVVTITDTLTYTVIHSNFTHGPACTNTPTQFNDSSYVNQNDVVNWRWNFGDGTAVVTGIGNPTHPFANAGTFNVKLVSYSTEGCKDSITKQIVVDTLPNINNSVHREQICSNLGTNIILTTNVINALYTWTATASSGTITGYSNNVTPAPSPISQVLVNTGMQTDSVTYIIIPHKGMCDGPSFTYVVVVFPKPNVHFNPTAPSICSNQTTNIALTSSVANPSFTWTATPGSPNVTGYGPGSGNVIAQTLITPGLSLETVTYHVVPTANTCLGDTANVLVLVNPRPHLLTTPMNQTICSTTSTNIVLIASCPGTTYTWTSAVVTGNITGNTAGSGSPIIQTLTNNLSTQGQVDYTIHPAAGSCVGNDTVFSVFVNPKPHVTTTPLTASICSNTMTNINLLADVTGCSFTWIATGSSGNVSGFTAGIGTPITQTLINSGLAIETVTYHIVATASGCSSDSAYFIVTVHPLPIPVITGSASVCLNSTTVYGTTAGMSGYLWTVSSGGTITSGAGTNSISINWTANGAQTITLNYTDAFGCTAATPTVFTATVSLLPIPGLVGGNSACIGSTVTYSTDPGMTSYSWIVSAGGTITAGGGPINNTVTVHWTVTGAQTVSVNYQAGPGCTASNPTVLNLTVQSLPVPAIAGSNSVCVGSTGVTYTAQAGMTGYTWSVSAGGIITAGGTAGDNFAIVTWNTTGAQTVSVNYTDGNGCTALAPTIYPVTILVLPIPAIAGPVSLCNGSTGIVYSTLAGQTNYLWNLSGGGIITAGGTTTDNTVTITWNATGIHTLTVNYHDANGCTAVSATSYAVTVYTLPVPVIGGNNKICTGSTGIIYTTQAGMTNYSWAVSVGGTITAGGSSSDNTVTVTWNTPGARTVSVNFNDPNGCTAVSATSYSVTVDPLPVPTIAGNNTLCAGTTGVIYTTQAGMNNYAWTVSAGGTITAGGSANDHTTTVTWNTAGVQSVMVNYHDLNGCTAIAPFVFPVTINPLPVPAITGAPALCAGTIDVLYSTQPGMSAYQWTVSVGGLIDNGSGTNQITVSWLTAGPKTVTVNYHDLNGCTAVSATVYPVTINPLPVPVIAGPATVCLNSTGIYLTTAGMTNYIWSVSAGGTITAGTGTNSISVQWNTIGPKTIQVNYIDANGCTAASPTSYTVTVSTLPVPSLNGLNSICSGLSTTYTTDAGMTNYSWTVSAGGSIIAGGGISDNTTTVLWNTAGAQMVSVNYVMGPGCTATSPSVYNVTVKPRPSATNVSNPTLCSNGTTNIILTASLPGTTFTWTVTGSSGSVTGFHPGAGFSITDNLINSGFNIETVNYAVTPSLNGCDGQIAHYIVTVNPVADVYFTPNGQSFCTGGTTSISVISHVAGATFTWTAAGSSGNVSGFGPGNTNQISQTLTNSGNNPESVTYTVSPTSNSCPGTNNSVVVNVNPFPATSYTLCNDFITTTAAQPFRLKGGVPLGGTYSGTGVNTGIFYPSIAGMGNHTITYSYSNTWGCVVNAAQVISVINPPVFLCDNSMNDIRDNQTYTTVKIGTQCWMAENLNYGNVIVSTQMQRDNCITEKYCFSDIPANCTSYGGLYQWDELMQFDNVAAAQGFCPPGWHVPTENEWNTLFNFYISNGFAGSPLKYTGYSGFDAFLSGTRFNNVNWNFSNFAVMFWSSTQEGNNKAWAHGMNRFNPSVSNYPGNRSNAFSIRCIKD